MKARKRGRTPIEEAVSMIVEETKGPIETELRALADSAGYVLAGDVRAVLDQPPFTRSPLDGYALRSADLNGRNHQFRPLAGRDGGKDYDRRPASGGGRLRDPAGGHRSGRAQGRVLCVH